MIIIWRAVIVPSGLEHKIHWSTDSNNVCNMFECTGACICVCGDNEDKPRQRPFRRDSKFPAHIFEFCFIIISYHNADSQKCARSVGMILLSCSSTLKITYVRACHRTYDHFNFIDNEFGFCLWPEISSGYNNICSHILWIYIHLNSTSYIHILSILLLWSHGPIRNIVVLPCN